MDTELTNFLDACENNSVVVVSMGSLVELSPGQLSALAAGVAAAGYCSVWSLKNQSAIETTTQLLSAGSKKFIVRSWLPQMELMQHKAVGAAVLHCGWNGIVEAISCALPIVALPMFGDQPANATKLEQLGVAIRPNNKLLTRVSVNQAVKQVMTNRRYKYQAKQLCENFLWPRPSDAVEMVEAVARCGVQHLRSEQDFTLRNAKHMCILFAGLGLFYACYVYSVSYMCRCH